MNSNEETQSHLPNPNPNRNLTPTPSPTPGTRSTVHLRRLGERRANDEEVMTPPFRLDQQQLELEDLRAFERRLVELAEATKPGSFHWVPTLGTISVCMAISACHWLPDVAGSQSIVLRSLSSRGALTLSLATIVLTIFLGVKHSTQSQPSGAVELSQDTLALFQLQCDSNGHFVRIPPTSQ